MAALQESGFVVLAGPYPVARLGVVADAYDAEVGSAVGDDIRIGSTSTRVVDFVNRGPLFDPLYVHPPLLDAAARIVGESFKLSSLHARTLLVFNGSTWHGQGVNGSNRPRRSLQGAFIPRGGRASTDFGRRMPSETRARLGSIAHHVLAISDSSA